MRLCLYSKILIFRNISKYFVGFSSFFLPVFCFVCNFITKTNKRNSKKFKQKRKARNEYRLRRFEIYHFVSQMSVVIRHHFPDFYKQLSQLPDYRKRPQYQVRELIVSGLLLFLFRQKSRNQADNLAKNKDYRDNIKKLFQIEVADMDTVDKYLRWLSPSMLEKIKQEMLKKLIQSKVLSKYRFKGKYLLAIDGSGLQSYDYEPYPGCPYKKYKSGKKVWTTYVLEAKIVSSNGFSLSLATEWIENPVDKEFNKQDSEQKAFVRLMDKIKKIYPRLPLLLLLDGLYPNDTVFKIAQKYNYSFIITLKDGNLKSVQEQIADMKLFKQYIEHNHCLADKTCFTEYQHKIYSKIEYKTHRLSVLETLERKRKHKANSWKEKRFMFISDIEAGTDIIQRLISIARMRWKIENEGFNNQKNNDYALTHKFSRVSFNATKNYYQLIQLADIISQLSFKLLKVKEFIKRYGLTIKLLIYQITSYLIIPELLDEKIIENILNKKQQLRY